MATHGHLPTRSNTVSTGYASDDDAVPTNDPSSTLGLLEERLQAWKHMCGYLEEYIKAVAKDQHQQSKDAEKILKTLNHPLKEGHHFDQAVGGVAGLFENLRANTNAQAQLNAETNKHLESTVLPILERLHKEIKAKNKEFESGAGKQSKTVEQARNSSQKQIELLGQHTATFDSAGGRTTAANDPYVLQRGVMYHLNRQVMEENGHRSDLINIQNNFSQFEAHVIQSIQNALSTYNQYMASAHDRSKAMYGDIASTAANIPPNFEWNGFLKRNGNVLISPDAPPRSIDNLSFPNQGHRATKPLIEGTLERKSRGLGGYKPAYYAVTPAGYLHEYKDNDNFRSEPVPETSLFLPDCVIGGIDGQRFAIKGKDSSGSKLTQKLHLTSEYQFQAHTASDAAQWHSVIAAVCSGQTNSLPNSPASARSMQNQIPHNLNTAAAQQPGEQAYGRAGYPTVGSAQELRNTEPGVGTRTNDFATQHASSGTGYTTGSVPQGEQEVGVARSGSYYSSPKTNELGPRQY